MADLNNLPQENITFKIKTSELCNIYEIFDPDDFDKHFDVISLSESYDITDFYGLEITREDGVFYDSDGKEISEDALKEIDQVCFDSVFVGTQNRYLKEVEKTIEDHLDTFRNFDYDYQSENFDTGVRQQEHGEAKGIISYDIDLFGDTTITANPDIVHVVNECITGYGMFGVDSELEGEDIDVYTKLRFHWTGYYWTIYGMFKPEFTNRDILDFDDDTLKSGFKSIEESYGIKIT